MGCHTCSGYVAANPEISTGHGGLDDPAEEVYDLAPSGDDITHKDVPRSKMDEFKQQAITTERKLFYFPANPFRRACRLAPMKMHAARAHEHRGQPPTR